LLTGPQSFPKHDHHDVTIKTTAPLRPITVYSLQIIRMAAGAAHSARTGRHDC